MIRRTNLYRRGAGAGPALLALACLLPAAGGASTSATRADAEPTATATTLAPTATATAAASACPTHAPGGFAPTATPPAPTPIPAGAWKTYPNTPHHYTREHPPTRRTSPTPPTPHHFTVRNTSDP